MNNTTRTKPWQLLRSIAAILAAILLALQGNLVFSTPLSDWKLAQFLVGYDDLGFVRRGLIATLYGFPNDTPVTREVVLVAAWPTVALVFVLALAISRLPDPRLALGLLVSPALFQQMGYDLGRFDQINLLISLVILLSSRSMAVLFLPLTVLIHEASLLVHIPLVLAIHLQRHGLDRAIVLCFGLLALTTVAVFGFAARPELTVLQAQFPNATEPSLAVHFNTMSDNIAYVVAWVAKLMPVDYAGFLAALCYLAALLTIYLRMGHPLIALAALTPLGLAFIGIDWGRWISLSATNLIIAILLGKKKDAQQKHSSHRISPVLFLVLLGFALIGPFGVTRVFPMLR